MNGGRTTHQDSQAQGAALEQLLCDLLSRVLRDDLGYHLLQASVQGSGAQYGKDIQVRWKQPDLGECFWHFECKSHTQGTLHQKEVADKIIDVCRSSHRIDAWCLALSSVEPNQWIDEVFAYAEKELNLPFCLAVLSPSRGFIKDLFACHPDLYTQLYPQEPMTPLTHDERQRRLASFSAFLSEASQRGREFRLRPHGALELVAPRRLASLEDRSDLRRAYLRGLTPTCPWEAVVHGWAVGRPTVEVKLLEEIRSTESGFFFRVLTGAAGEGKSTVMRRIAWEAANDPDQWAVLWTDAYFSTGAASFPIRWIDALRDGSRVLICVDGSRQLEAIALGCKSHWELREDGKRVFVLMADRGNEWHRSPARSALYRCRQSPDEKRVPLAPLSPREQVNLVDTLEATGLLWGKSPELATRRLEDAAHNAADAPDRPYLLPTIMQLTDPQDRGFEKILADLLTSLPGEHDPGASRIMLAASMLHAAGTGLPRDLAERIAGDAGKLAHALALLQSELQHQLQYSPSTFGEAALYAHYYVHHRVVADAIVGAAYSHPFQKEVLLAVCRDMPIVMKRDLLADLLLPPQHFAILDQTVDYLDQEKGVFEAAEALLTSWYILDERGFPALHRLAECCLRWLQQELKEEPPDLDLVQTLASRSRAAFAKTLDVARPVLAAPDKAPARLRRYQYREVEFKTYHGWSVLENTMARLADTAGSRMSCLLRSVLLSLLALEPTVTLRQERSCCGTLALSLIDLGEYEVAAKVVAAEVALRQRPDVLKHHRKALASAGAAVPEPGLEPLADAIAQLATGPLLHEWRSIAMFPDCETHLRNVAKILERALSWVPSTESIAEALRIVESQLVSRPGNNFTKSLDFLED